LDSKTILYRDELQAFVDDASISTSASLSCASSVRSSPKSVVSTPMSANSSVDSGSLLSPGTSVNGDPDHAAALQKELAYLRSKLAKKDKVVSELQRQITRSDAVSEEATRKLTTYEVDLKKSNEINQSLQKSMQSAEKKLQSHEASVLRMQGVHESAVASLDNRIVSQAEKIAALEKANKVLQNEKALLNAAVEARESKLTKMGELQVSFEQLSEKVAQHDALRMQLEESGKRYESIKQDLEQVRQLEQQWKSELESTKTNVATLTTQIEGEEKRTAAALVQLEPLQKKNQQLKGERNSYKQKNDGLLKEISRLCKSGRSIKDIEKILLDSDALVEEVETLRRQKRKALEEAHTYRTSYEQSKVAQQASGIDYETHRSLERNAELERLLAEMTEYVTAKEMQLETYKQINEQLQVEIRSLAQASLSKNEV
jgi:exonuclease SbcC